MRTLHIAAAAVGVAFVVAIAAAVSMGVFQITVISLTAALAMLGFGLLADRVRPSTGLPLIWSYGLASGAMIVSTAVFLFPNAITVDPAIGGIGIAGGYLLGYLFHTAGHQIQHSVASFDDRIIALTTHAILAGLVIGVIYQTLPDPGLLLGLSIISHKGPAGYTTLESLTEDGRPRLLLVFPALALGLAAIPMAFFPISLGTTQTALLFGVSAGVFFHVATDFIPRCEAGSDIYERLNGADADHATLDMYRRHSVFSLITGAGIVVALWLLI